MTLQLDEDDTISDLADSDAEVKGGHGVLVSFPICAVMWCAFWLTVFPSIKRRREAIRALQIGCKREGG